jgi:quercetin dioxygenase-like cupin family protein
MSLDGVDTSVRAGSLVFVQRGVRHSIVASETAALTWLSIVTPNEDAPDAEIVVP